jgi:hypothetical protein
MLLSGNSVLNQAQKKHLYLSSHFEHKEGPKSLVMPQVLHLIYTQERTMYRRENVCAIYTLGVWHKEAPAANE